MKVFTGWGSKQDEVVVSLCDFSGNWPKPWHEAGHTVLCFDLKHGDDVTDVQATLEVIRAMCGSKRRVVSVLMAPPCTDFTISGAQYWKAKDADGRTAASLAVVDVCLRISAVLRAEVWALENPVGRLQKLMPGLGKPLYVQPHAYAHLADDLDGDRYTKKTGLWGDFDRDALVALAQDNGGPIRVCSQGSWLMKLGGKSERTKELRSVTPMGIARAFHRANEKGGVTAPSRITAEPRNPSPLGGCM